MLIGISGTLGSGKTEVARYLTQQGFKLIKFLDSGVRADSSISEYAKFDNLEELVDYVTTNWLDNYVISHIDDLPMLEALQKRPFFLHISIDAPLHLRFLRFQGISLEEFVNKSDDLLFNKQLIEINNQAQVKIINTSNSIEKFQLKLSELDLSDFTRLRPNWDSYFMRLANLAALRSNCMKRRVGCVIVRKFRVVATGYNGTPRHLKNCNEGGCSRCNGGHGSGAALSTCLCLHAEENALLEAGRDRIGEDSIVYCNTCPCLTCSIKIVQCGVKEVVYAQSYSMDDATKKVMSDAGIILRQYQPPIDGIFI